MFASTITESLALVSMVAIVAMVAFVLIVVGGLVDFSLSRLKGLKLKIFSLGRRKGTVTDMASNDEE